jgi:hypothetical protein
MMTVTVGRQEQLRYVLEAKGKAGRLLTCHSYGYYVPMRSLPWPCSPAEFGRIYQAATHDRRRTNDERFRKHPNYVHRPILVVRSASQYRRLD